MQLGTMICFLFSKIHKPALHLIDSGFNFFTLLTQHTICISTLSLLKRQAHCGNRVLAAYTQNAHIQTQDRKSVV